MTWTGQKTLRAFLTAAATVALTAGTAAVAAPASAGPSEGAPGSSARSEHQRIVDYWTDERRASAVPRDVAPRPAAKPGGKGPGGGGDSTGSVLGATWSGDGYAEKVTGKVFFTLGASRYVCSGSAVATGTGTDVVLSAGHCVHDGDGGSFATNWIFYPAYDSRFTLVDPSLREWTASRLFTTPGWAEAGDFADDAGFAVVGNGSGGSLQALAAPSPLPTVDFALDAADASASFTALGYPAAQKYKGATLTYCRGPVTDTRDSFATLSMGCNMTGGSSGGPWFRDYPSGTRVIQSLNSYGYQSLSGYMFGPKLGEAEQAAFEAASGATCSAAGAPCAALP